VFPASRGSNPAAGVPTGVRRSSRAPRDTVSPPPSSYAVDDARTRRPAITTPIKPASWTYAEGFVAEDEALASARARAEEVGVVPIGPGGGAALRFLASVLDARAVVEIGTGTGVSGLWLLRGMRADGVLTTVDIEAEHQRLARQSFTEAGIPQQRARTISGAALDVLPRLTDGHYDIVFCDGDKREYAAYLKEALRLLRPGGVVAFDNALWHDRVADPAQRDAETVAIRDLGRAVADDEGLVPVLLPVGDGLLVAKKEWSPEA
jgi:predicted O-methyltransferase YrrM